MFKLSPARQPGVLPEEDRLREDFNIELWHLGTTCRIVMTQKPKPTPRPPKPPAPPPPAWR